MLRHLDCLLEPVFSVESALIRQSLLDGCPFWAIENDQEVPLILDLDCMGIIETAGPYQTCSFSQARSRGAR